MRHAQFLVLTGRLGEFPLYDLLETLRGQRKTGRLLVEFTAGPATFHFSRGALVDAQLGELRGPEALMLALSIEDSEAAFNFNPLVSPPRTQNPDAAAPARGERFIEIVPTEPADSSAASLPTARAQSDAYALPPAPGGGEMLVRLTQIEKTLVTQSRRAHIERAAYALVTIALILFAFNWRGRDPGARVVESPAPGTQAGNVPGTAGTPEPPPSVVAAQPQLSPERAQEPLAGGVKKPERPNTARPQAAAAVVSTPPATTPQTGGRAVQVSLTVEQGRVVRAEVSDPRPGMSAYEALALRLARQRRFPADFSGRETLRLKVGQ